MTHSLPILTIVVYRDADAGPTLREQVRAHGVASAVLRIDPALDDVVSLAVQQHLAELSPTFAAELAAQSTMLESFAKLTEDVVASARVPETAAELGTEAVCAVCDHGIYRVSSTSPWSHLDSSSGDKVGIHLATPAAPR